MFACLYAPDFPVQASLLSEPAETRTALKQFPLAILDGPSNLPRIFAANPAARRMGIQIGMTKLQVETYGGTVLRKHDHEAADLAQKTLVEYGSRFSPRVESTTAGAVILDLAGTKKLFGSLESVARKMNEGAREIGFDLHIAIASNPDASFYAARGFPGTTIIPESTEAQRLSSLSVNVLPATPEILEILEGWGIRTFHALATLPAVAIVERLGQEGLHLQKLARGEIERPLLTVEPEAEFTETFEFDDPVETLESLFFILNRLLQQLSAKLVSAALATNELRLWLELEVRQTSNGQAGEQYKHEWKLPVPTQDKNVLFSLVRLQLEQTTFSAPVRKLTLEVVPIKPRVAQGNFFAPPSPEPERVEITLERIRGIVGTLDDHGKNCVGSPHLLDTHQPDSFKVKNFVSSDELQDSAPAKLSFIALRVFRPAIRTSVELDGEKPHFIWLWQRQRRVLAASGPWVSSGNWWNASAWIRQEWDVALKTPAGVGHYRIYHDRVRKQWFVAGVFD